MLRQTAETSRRWKWLSFAIGCIATAAVAAAFAYPGVKRCVMYHRVFIRGQAALSLAPQPRLVAIDEPADVSRLSIGYADVSLPLGWADRISIAFNAVVMVEHGDESIIFMPPFYSSQFSSDGDYSWEIARSRARALPLSQVFTMSRREYEQLVLETIPKAADTSNQNGIGHFATDHVRGIIRYGSTKEPGKMSLQVWSQHGQIRQWIYVRGRTPAAAQELVQSVLSGFRYLVRHVPTDEALVQNMRQALEAHDAFVPADRNDENVSLRCASWRPTGHHLHATDDASSPGRVPARDGGWLRGSAPDAHRPVRLIGPETVNPGDEPGFSLRWPGR